MGRAGGPPGRAAGAMSDALVCVLESSSPVAVLRLTGLLDVATAVEVRAALHKTITGQPSAIVVDLAGVTVNDEVVLTLFAAVARTAAGWPGCPVLLCAPSPTVHRGLDRMGVARALPIYPDRATAMAAAGELPAPRRFGQRLPAKPIAAYLARDVVAAACRAWRLPHLADEAQLVVTELVSNAVRHAGGELELLIVVREHFLHVSVRDGSPEPPRRILPDEVDGQGGRGLLLVDAFTAGWGCSPMPDGKVVWATLHLRR